VKKQRAIPRIGGDGEGVNTVTLYEEYLGESGER
jgi:hypothetical protein